MNRPRFANHRPLLVFCLLAAYACEVQAGPPTAEKKPANQTLDLFAEHKDEYVTPASPTLVNVGPAKYLAIAGRGAPGGETFVAKIRALYTVAFTLKMQSQAAGRDFNVGISEGLWWGNGNEHDFTNQPRDTWNWKLLMRVPDFVTDKELAKTTGMLGGGDKTAVVNEVKIETLTEGQCVQVLHVGPYANEPTTIAAMRDFATKRGLVLNGRHHEIYLDNPNRTDPATLRTILRQPVGKSPK